MNKRIPGYLAKALKAAGASDEQLQSLESQMGERKRISNSNQIEKEVHDKFIDDCKEFVSYISGSLQGNWYYEDSCGELASEDGRSIIRFQRTFDGRVEAVFCSRIVENNPVGFIAALKSLKDSI